ncbi:hypothetical protein IPM62_02100 [Candidatus Woesebacteria bacterium]|nr:MAG: hypothetical protein IPM62_02100 [Candidatus Woesebacteria bacterium]
MADGVSYGKKVAEGVETRIDCFSPINKAGEMSLELTRLVLDKAKGDGDMMTVIKEATEDERICQFHRDGFSTTLQVLTIKLESNGKYEVTVCAVGVNGDLGGISVYKPGEERLQETLISKNTVRQFVGSTRPLVISVVELTIEQGGELFMSTDGVNREVATSALCHTQMRHVVNGNRESDSSEIGKYVLLQGILPQRFVQDDMTQVLVKFSKD